MMFQFGRDHVHAPPSHQREAAHQSTSGAHIAADGGDSIPIQSPLSGGSAAPDVDGLTNATFGRSSFDSSASASLQSCLENRLRARLDVHGSLEYVLTWKHWDMPSGPLICALRARARRTSDSAFSGWPTPCSDRVSNRVDTQLSGDGRTTPNKLGWAVSLTGWPTCTQTDARRGGQVTAKSDALNLNAAIQLMSSTAETAKLGALVLNPAMSRWLQTFPESWDRHSPGWDKWEFAQHELTTAAASAPTVTQ